MLKLFSIIAVSHLSVFCRGVKCEQNKPESSTVSVFRSSNSITLWDERIIFFLALFTGSDHPLAKVDSFFSKTNQEES